MPGNLVVVQQHVAIMIYCKKKWCFFLSFLSLGFLCLDGKAWGEWAFNFRQIRGISSATTLPGCMGHANLLNKCCVWIKSVLDKGLTAPTFESFETVGENVGGAGYCSWKQW